MDEAKRFNEGKLRYDLVHPWAHEQMVKVLTAGSLKYEERNWEKGMAWSKVIASLKRHLAAIEKGEDYDPETGELHIAHLACNAHFLTAYYKIAPQYDDRPQNHRRHLKIGLDIDEVLCDCIGGMMEKYPEDMPERSTYWKCPMFNKHLEEEKYNKEFWLNLKPTIDPKSLPFEPHCYITSRSIDVSVTEEWLAKHGFPKAPVYSVPGSKVEAARQAGVDIFVDDNIKNFTELNNAGICTFLMSAPHNLKYSVGFKRISNLKELVE